MSAKDWTEATSLAKELHAWRRERVRGPPQPQPSQRHQAQPQPGTGTPPGGRGGGEGDLLFGSGIVFNFDLDCPEEEDDLDRAFPWGFANNRGVGGDREGRSGGFKETRGVSGTRFSEGAPELEGLVGDSAKEVAEGRGGRGERYRKGGMEAGVADADEPWKGEGRGEGGGGGQWKEGAEEEKGERKDASRAALPPALGGKKGAVAAKDEFDAGWLYSR